MKRLVFSILLGLFILPLAGSWGQTPLTDRDIVTAYDRTKGAAKQTKELPGEIQQESATGITVKTGGGFTAGRVYEIPVADIIDVVYKVPDKAVGKAYMAAMVMERKTIADKLPAAEKKRLLDEAIQAYQALLPKFKSNPQGHRHLEYKIARLTLQQAADDKTLMKSAVTQLAAFRKYYPNSWQITLVMDKLADLQRDSGDFKGASQTYDDMSQMKALPADKRKRYEQEAAMALLRGKDHKAAKDRLTRIRSSLKSDDPQYFRLDMYIAQCDAGSPGEIDKAIARLRKTILATKETDKFRKSVVHATLGDCYLAKGDPYSLLLAIFEFLKVDLIYSSDQGGDKQEHARVCTELARLFRNRAINQQSRAKEYEEKAEHLRR